MTQAKSVLSTPPTNTSVTRRKILGTAAGAAAALAATGANPMAASPAPDPIHAAIKRHSDLAKTYDAAWKVRGDCKDYGDLTEAEKTRLQELNDATDAAALPLEAAAMDLFDTVPTTRAGIITALFYMRIQHRNDGEHMVQGRFEDEHGEDYIDWRDGWLETLIQAVMQLDDAAAQS